MKREKRRYLVHTPDMDRQEAHFGNDAKKIEIVDEAGNKWLVLYDERKLLLSQPLGANHSADI